MGIRLEDMEKEKINKGIDDFINSWHEAISPNTNPNHEILGSRGFGKLDMFSNKLFDYFFNPYPKENKYLGYICKDNGNIIRFQLLDGEIDELLISAPGETGEIVISYRDLKKAIKKVKKHELNR